MSRKNCKEKRRRHHRERLKVDEERHRKILQGLEKCENPPNDDKSIEEVEEDWVDNSQNGDAMAVEKVPRKKKIHKKKDKLTQRRTI